MQESVGVMHTFFSVHVATGTVFTSYLHGLGVLFSNRA